MFWVKANIVMVQDQAARVTSLEPRLHSPIMLCNILSNSSAYLFVVLRVSDRFSNSFISSVEHYRNICHYNCGESGGVDLVHRPSYPVLKCARAFDPLHGHPEFFSCERTAYVWLLECRRQPRLRTYCRDVQLALNIPPLR